MTRGLDRYSVHALPQLDMFGSSISRPVPPRVAIEVRVILERIYAICRQMDFITVIGTTTLQSNQNVGRCDEC